MADEVDSGDIAYVERTPIQADDTARSLYLRTINAAMLTVRNLLDDLSSGAELPRHAMPDGYGAFYARTSVASLADVTELVNAEQLSHIARATFFPPSNTAHFFFGGKKYLLVPESEIENISLTGKSINEPQL